MSQIHKVGEPSIGKPSTRIKWDDFVKLVLKLTIRAYRNLRQDKKVQLGWEEDTFTVNLESYLRPIALENGIVVNPFNLVITDDMRNGKQSLKEAKEIDLSLFGPWRDYDEKHFVWEAKRIAARKTGKAYKDLCPRYIKYGIYRFIKRKYAANVRSAGMLGYVLIGEPNVIIEDINQTMGRIREKNPLPPSNHLKAVAPVDDFKDIFQSHHTRTDSTEIALHHLFLCFDFAD